MLTHIRYEFETIDAESFSKLVFKAGLGKVKHIMHDIEVLDWDTNCWVVEMNSGEIKSLTKTDATFREVSPDRLLNALNKTRQNLQNLERAMETFAALKSN